MQSSNCPLPSTHRPHPEERPLRDAACGGSSGQAGASRRIDKVTLEILANHARAAAENMAYTLYRTAHSTFVKETQDFTVMLTDTAGLTVAVPMDLGATWYPGISYRRAIELVGDYEPGDIAFTN